MKNGKGLCIEFIGKNEEEIAKMTISGIDEISQNSAFIPEDTISIKIHRGDYTDVVKIVRNEVGKIEGFVFEPDETSLSCPINT